MLSVILFINGVKEVYRERTISFLKSEHQSRIANVYHDFKDIEGFASVATNEEILANGGNLNVPLYVRRRVVREEQVAYATNRVTEAVRAWEESSEKLNAVANDLLKSLE